MILRIPSPSTAAARRRRRTAAGTALIALLLAALPSRGEDAKAPASAAVTGSPTMDRILKRGRIVVGSAFKYRPLNTRNRVTGEREGFLVDVGKALSRKIFGDENRIEWTYSGGKGIDSLANIQWVLRGDVDMLIDAVGEGGHGRTKTTFVDISDEVIRAGDGLLVRKDSPIKSVADLKKGTTIAVDAVAADVPHLKEKAPDATYVIYEDDLDAIEAVKSGAADALSHHFSHLYDTVAREPGLKITGIYDRFPYGIVTKKGDPVMAKYLNDFIKELNESGEHDRLYHKWFDPLGGL